MIFRNTITELFEDSGVMKAIIDEKKPFDDVDGLVRVTSSPRVKEFRDRVTQDRALAEIVGAPHTTQAFDSAEDLADAFAGRLTRLSETHIASTVLGARNHFQNLIESAGVPDERLREMLGQVWIYSRLDNPISRLLEDAMSNLEGTEGTRVFSSGLAAIDATVRQFTKPAHRGSSGEYVPGDLIVVVGSMYGGTFAQMQDTCHETGRRFGHLPISDFVKDGLPGDTSLVFVEPCNNPTLRFVPLDRIVAEAKRVGAVSIADNTFTPFTVRPCDLGVDFTVHSMTKYINGRSEGLGGSVSGREEDVAKFCSLASGRRMLGGAVMDPCAARSYLSNMRNLPERLFGATRQAKDVKGLAARYNIKARIVEDYSEYRANRMSDVGDGFSNGMVALYFPNVETASRFVNRMIANEAGFGAVSLGAIRTYFSIPSLTTHSEMPLVEQEKIGITPGLVRMSCGLESDLVEKMEKVLADL